jgi:hypothetical protein
MYVYCPDSLGLQIREAKTLEEVGEAVMAASDMLTMMGSMRPIRTMENRDLLLEQVIQYYFVVRCAPAFAQ